jgi:hypothetical protein
MKDLTSILEESLASTEANGLIVARSKDTNRIWVLPYWEAENEEYMESQAIRNAITWADENGAGDIEVAFGFRDDLTT